MIFLKFFFGDIEISFKKKNSDKWFYHWIKTSNLRAYIIVHHSIKDKLVLLMIISGILQYHNSELVALKIISQLNILSHRYTI